MLASRAASVTAVLSFVFVKSSVAPDIQLIIILSDGPPVRSDPPKQYKNDNDDQDDAEETDAAVTEAVTVAAKAATEATEQSNDEDDNEDGSERHGFAPVAGPD
jgi:hypothetical protein